MMSDHFSRFEDHIQRLVEGGFARLFADHLHPREVAVQLARALEDDIRTMSDGHRIAPDIYTVRLNPQDHAAILEQDEDLAEQLTAELLDMARSAGLTLTNLPDVQLIADDSVPLKEIEVNARHSESNKSETTEAMPLEDLQQALMAAAPEASLLLEGERQVPISQPIVNIGRHRDNTIILDNPRISRHHAQIRFRFGHYVLFDLGSAAGTQINGEQIQQQPLQPGDVITLAGSSLIYVEGSDTPSSPVDKTLDETQNQPPANA